VHLIENVRSLTAQKLGQLNVAARISLIILACIIFGGLIFWLSTSRKTPNFDVQADLAGIALEGSVQPCVRSGDLERLHHEEAYRLFGGRQRSRLVNQ
jgi:hypothetical protein